ncbi:glycoside hydrolase family 76 protein [Xylariaceae sp. FL1651]|nr:glycoside hydrolase family 76 protein [Xylariaceae sp. FL1651]
MARLSSASLARLFFSIPGALAGLAVDVDDVDSIKKAAAVVAGDLMSFYKGDIPGILPGPPPDGDYYWWTGGALWTAMLDYRSRTGDTQYDDKISQGLLWQTGSNQDYMPANWTASEGNDDQATWGMAALLAAETGFTEPKAGDPKWVTLAQTVFDEQSNAARHVEKGGCEGALRWQIFTFNNGYNYVSTTANAAYLNLGARLSLLGGNNKTAATLVGEAFDKLQSLGLIDDDFNVFDGAHAPDCDDINKLQLSYAPALALEGAAVMYNSTGGDSKWKKLVDGLVGRTIDVFFPDGVATEVACEPSKCSTDMTFFKSSLHRSLASTMKVAPYTAEIILPVLKSSTVAAAQSCTGGDNGRMCGLVWSDKFDGVVGAGSQISVLSALLSLLPAETTAAIPSNSNNGNTTSSTPSGSSPTTSQSTVPGSSAVQVGISFLMLMGSMLLTSMFN